MRYSLEQRVAYISDPCVVLGLVALMECGLESIGPAPCGCPLVLLAKGKETVTDASLQHRNHLIWQSHWL